MRSAPSPFTDSRQVSGPLYASADRIARRTSALHRARITGRHAAEVIADLAAEAVGISAEVVADLGCGRGTTTRLLAQRLPRSRVVAVDLSAPLLVVARSRVSDSSPVSAVRADFHRLPFGKGSWGLAVAAFCLYHSPAPERVISEIARCLAPGGTVIIAVKSADSYRELDQAVAASGLDPDALARPSLYQAAHSGNIEQIAAGRLAICRLTHETHLDHRLPFKPCRVPFGLGLSRRAARHGARRRSPLCHPCSPLSLPSAVAGGRALGRAAWAACLCLAPVTSAVPALPGRAGVWAAVEVAAASPLGPEREAAAASPLASGQGAAPCPLSRPQPAGSVLR